MEESWLNPNFATDHLVLLALVVLAALIFLPVLFGALIYSVLGLYQRLSDWRRHAHHAPDVAQEDIHDEAPV